MTRHATAAQRLRPTRSQADTGETAAAARPPCSETKQGVSAQGPQNRDALPLAADLNPQRGQGSGGARARWVDFNREWASHIGAHARRPRVDVESIWGRVGLLPGRSVSPDSVWGRTGSIPSVNLLSSRPLKGPTWGQPGAESGRSGRCRSRSDLWAVPMPISAGCRLGVDLGPPHVSPQVSNRGRANIVPGAIARSLHRRFRGRRGVDLGPLSSLPRFSVWGRCRVAPASLLGPFQC